MSLYLPLPCRRADVKRQSALAMAMQQSEAVRAGRNHGLSWAPTVHVLYRLHFSYSMWYWHQGNNISLFILYSAHMKSVLKHLTAVLVCRSNNESHLGYWRLFGYHHLGLYCHTLHSAGRPLLCCLHRCHPDGFHYLQPGKSCAFLW